MVRALAQRDIGAVYRLPLDHGVSQRYLASWSDRASPRCRRLSAAGRCRAMRYSFGLQRVSECRVERWAFAYAGDDEGPMLFDDVTEDMRRRALLAAATTALFGALILGEVLELPERPNIPTPLLANLAQADIDAIDRLTRALESEARYYGGGAAVISPAARRAERLLKVPAAEALRPALMVGLADLHNVAA
jgi:hypothetical protein